MTEAMFPHHLHAQDYGICTQWPVRADLWRSQTSDPPHDHDFMEFNLVVSGRGTHRSATGEREVSRGDLLLLLPGVWHVYHTCTDLTVYNCVFQKELLENELAWLKQEPALAYALFSAPLMEEFRGIWHTRVEAALAERCVEQLAKLPELVRDGAAKPDRGTRSGVIATFLAFLVIIEQHLHWLHEKSGLIYPPPHPIVQELARLLYSDLARPWTLGELASSTLCNRSYLVRLCRQHTGLSPMRLLARMRADRAAYLLARTALPIQKVGDSVGWPEPYHFAKRFRDHFHQSASSYRRANR